MAGLSITGDLVLKGEYSNDTITPGVTLPVDGVTDTERTVVTRVLPVDPGDVLDIDVRSRVTNDTGKSRSQAGYTVGVGARLYVYDHDPEPGPDGTVPTASEREWTKIGPSWGDNVSRDRHHLPIHITAHWQVPADWPVGHRIVVVLRLDAHSTAAVAGDVLPVDPGYTLLKVSRKGLPAA